jgi:hypothetical protein
VKLLEQVHTLAHHLANYFERLAGILPNESAELGARDVKRFCVF